MPTEETKKKTDQRINHRTREEPKEQTTAPEKNQNESKDQTPNSQKSSTRGERIKLNARKKRE
jgi:hypothetical protein